MDLAEKWYLFFNKPAPNMVLRIIIMTFGMAWMAFAIALTRSTGLGTSPISCVPTTLSFINGWSLGTWSFIINLLFIASQTLLLRRDYKPIQLLQIPIVFVFSVMIDLFVPLTELLPMPNYFIQLCWNAAGCVFIAFGVFLTVKASLITLPGEGITLAITKVIKKPFPKVKLTFDFSNVILAVILSLIFMGGLYGVREGTLISACAGVVVGFFNRLMPRFERFCPIEGHITLTSAGIASPDKANQATETNQTTTQDHPKAPTGAYHAGRKVSSPTQSMNTASRNTGQSVLPGGDGITANAATNATTTKPLVITVSREYGSGGRLIGHALGKILDIPVYDELLIEMTAKETGMTPEYVKTHGESVRRGIFYSLYMQNYEYIGEQPSEFDTLYLGQANTITKLADQGSCVIVGRNANAILARRPNVFNVYIHAPLQVRLERVMERNNLDRNAALERIDRIDKERAAHTRLYTGQTWGDVDNYHLALDSSLAPIEGIAQMIARIATRAPIVPTATKDNLEAR